MVMAQRRLHTSGTKIDVGNEAAFRGFHYLIVIKGLYTPDSSLEKLPFPHLALYRRNDRLVYGEILCGGVIA